LYGNSNSRQFGSVEARNFPLDENWPKNVKLSIRSYDKDEYIIRLHNLNENITVPLRFFDAKNNNFILNQFLEVNKSIVSAEIHELSLSTNQLRSDVLKNKFVYRELNDVKPTDLIQTNLSIVTLRPMEMRTFFIGKITLKDGITPPLISEDEFGRNNEENSIKEPLISDDQSYFAPRTSVSQEKAENMDELVGGYANFSKDLVVILTVTATILLVFLMVVLTIAYKIRKEKMGRRNYEVMVDEKDTEEDDKESRVSKNNAQLNNNEDQNL